MCFAGVVPIVRLAFGCKDPGVMTRSTGYGGELSSRPSSLLVRAIYSEMWQERVGVPDHEMKEGQQSSRMPAERVI